MSTVVCLVPYRATDRRVYNGALCTDMQKESVHTAALRDRMKKADPEAHCTYFPMEGKFMVFVGIKMLTGVFHNDSQNAMIEAITVLEAR